MTDNSIRTLAVLKDARGFIDKEDSWTRNTYARDSKGEAVGEMESAAVCFCTLGAIRKAVPDLTHDFDVYRDAREAVAETLQMRWESVKAANDGPMPPLNVPCFNDHPETTHADVLALFDDTIKRLSE